LTARAAEDGTNLTTLSAILGHPNLKRLSRNARPSENLSAGAIRKPEKSQATAARGRKAAYFDTAAFGGARLPCVIVEFYLSERKRKDFNLCQHRTKKAFVINN
jgi:hypothetical protein